MNSNFKVKAKIIFLLIIVKIAAVSPLSYAVTLIEVGDITHFLNTQPQNTLEFWFKNKLEQKMDKQGIQSAANGLIFKKNFTHNKTSCSRRRHYSSIDVAFTLKNPSALHVEMSGINNPIVSNLHLDGQLDVEGYYRAEPHIDYGIFGCDGVGKATIDIDENFYFTADITTTINANVEFMPENLTATGYPTLSVSPEGSIKALVKQWRNDNKTSIDVDSDILKTLGLLFGGLPGVIIGEILDNVVSDKAEKKAKEVIKEFFDKKLAKEMHLLSTNGYSIDISNELGGYQEYILPNENEIREKLGRKILEHNKIIPILCGEINKDPARALVSALTDSDHFESHYIGSERGCSVATLIAII